MREKIVEWKMNDMCLILIGCLDFSHFNNLNSFILGAFYSTPKYIYVQILQT